MLIKRVLNKKEAMEYLGIGRARFDAELKAGNIRGKKIGRNILFPLWVLEEWLKDTRNFTDFTKEVKDGILISLSQQKQEKEYSLEALVAQQTETKLNNSVLTKSTKFRNKQQLNPVAM